MAHAEQAGVDYLFKLRLSAKVKKLIERLMRGADWTDAGQGWQGAQAPLRLSGWSRARRAVVLRRRITLRRTAEQLTPMQRWCRVLSRALIKYLNGRQLRPPALLPAPS